MARAGWDGVGQHPVTGIDISPAITGKYDEMPQAGIATVEEVYHMLAHWV